MPLSDDLSTSSSELLKKQQAEKLRAEAAEEEAEFLELKAAKLRAAEAAAKLRAVEEAAESQFEKYIAPFFSSIYEAISSIIKTVFITIPKIIYKEIPSVIFTAISSLFSGSNHDATTEQAQSPEEDLEELLDDGTSIGIGSSLEGSDLSELSKTLDLPRDADFYSMPYSGFSPLMKRGSSYTQDWLRSSTARGATIEELPEDEEPLTSSSGLSSLQP